MMTVAASTAVKRGNSKAVAARKKPDVARKAPAPSGLIANVGGREYEMNPNLNDQTLSMLAMCAQLQDESDDADVQLKFMELVKRLLVPSAWIQLTIDALDDGGIRFSSVFEGVQAALEEETGFPTER